jgi:transcriptional regulator
MDLPETFLHTMLAGIVAFEMQISRLEGKFKLSQNRSRRDQELVVERLLASKDYGETIGGGCAKELGPGR